MCQIVCVGVDLIVENEVVEVVDVWYCVVYVDFFEESCVCVCVVFGL